MSGLGFDKDKIDTKISLGEQAGNRARSFGLEPGTKEWNNFIPRFMADPSYDPFKQVDQNQTVAPKVVAPKKQSRENKLMELANDFAKRNKQFSNGASGMAEAAKGTLYK